MSAHPDAFARLAERIRRTENMSVIDSLLDQWLVYKNLATDWDAQQWGFDSQRWMRKERAELAKRVVTSDSQRSLSNL